jgi:hypothetical protein
MLLNSFENPNFEMHAPLSKIFLKDANKNMALNIFQISIQQNKCNF